MRNILIPTDFSPIADNALDYAIEIAAQFKSELYLCHVYSFNRRLDYDWNIPDDEQPYVLRLNRKIKATQREFEEKITQNGLSIRTIVEEGHIYSLFKEMAIEHNIDLMVMGSKGASGLQKIIFGSVAAHALELAKVPILVVPPNHSFHKLKKIVLATDLINISESILTPLQKLAFKFGAEVTILKVKTDSRKDPIENIDLYLKEVETTYHEVPMSKGINESINEYLDENQSDLLCMVRREKGFLESIFQRSITLNQVYINKIPLLVLPEISPK